MQPSELVVYVDDTLVRQTGTKRIPMVAVVAHVREPHRAGAMLFCWSAGGTDYPRPTVLGIEALFTGFLPKPHVLAGIAAVGVARRQDCDDVLFRLVGHRCTYALVHLTWRTWREGANPKLPWTELCEREEGLVALLQNEGWGMGSNRSASRRVRLAGSATFCSIRTGGMQRSLC